MVLAFFYLGQGSFRSGLIQYGTIMINIIVARIRTRDREDGDSESISQRTSEYLEGNSNNYIDRHFELSSTIRSLLGRNG
jgi:hypothetical protein